MPPDNLVQPFRLEALSLRGRLVRLGDALETILGQHAYPDPVAQLLGEALVLGTALGTSLKFKGVFTFQAKGDGPVRMLVADITNDGGLRAYAQFSDVLETPLGDVATLLGKGFLAFTVDQQINEDRYQGIVSLENGSLAHAVQHYFLQSEQLPTGLLAVVRRDSDGHWRGGCLMLQRMPREGGITQDLETNADEDWRRAMLLMATCRPEELTDPTLSAHDLLYRLFHEEGVRVYDPLPLRAQCRCSDERVSNLHRA